MTTQNWLPLNEYSAKHKISLSTLRRRIRAAAIQYRFEDGKYWIFDGTTESNISQTYNSVSTERNENSKIEIEEQHSGLDKQPAGEIMLESANKLLQEIKGAYISVLHEKEAQIMALKDELADLKTLIKTLEYENNRLKTKPTESALIDNWFESNI